MNLLLYRYAHCVHTLSQPVAFSQLLRVAWFLFVRAFHNFDRAHEVSVDGPFCCPDWHVQLTDNSFYVDSHEEYGSRISYVIRLDLILPYKTVPANSSNKNHHKDAATGVIASGDQAAGSITHVPYMDCAGLLDVHAIRIIVREEHVGP